MKVEIKERTPECQSAYMQGHASGYGAACSILRKQMLDKMEHYRGLLRLVLNESVPAKDAGAMIQRELERNPEFEVLEHMPHGKLIQYAPDAYKSINTGP